MGNWQKAIRKEFSSDQTKSVMAYQEEEHPKQTENDAQHTFKAPCCCFENALNTDLLSFEQSM